MITLPFRIAPAAFNLLLMLLGLAVFGVLGTWQLERSSERRAALDAFANAGAEPPVAGLDQVPAGGDYLRVRVTGRYRNGRQILLDNMTHEGVRGYHVLTPLHTAEGAVLVNRGFVAGHADRSRLPDIAVGEQQRELTAMAAPYFRRGLRLENASAGDSWPRRLVYPAAGELRELLGAGLPDYQLLLDSAQPDGYVRAWRPYGLAPERHLAYAVQWYGLAAAAVGIWLAITLKRRRTRNAD